MKPVTLWSRILIPAIAMAWLYSGVHAADDFASRRAGMVKVIAALTADTSTETGRHALDARVMAAMEQVPRHKFVPPEEEPYAYENRPLPIGYGQTISQPYIVALMTDLMRVKPTDVVLEVGTGSGYQAAILATLARAVYTIEIVEPLGRQAQERLQRLAYKQVETRVGDGYYGWEAHAPYDAIVVTAAASHVPPPLMRQLKPGGRMVIPVGAQFLTQYLLLIEKSDDGTVSTQQILPVRFVPLVAH
ncbi:Protein-L-isoaspartate O-methyltransferase [Pararobbsia alpina]|uniref:Protein-L-isoaspartate O-methyltransferase n=2 Tax=Pararobbsia alpina TaxID=621374 RepID=A0A6S7BZF2_9BURK|nr:protein-L-isoaspartate(D-aspartate) O-methyltransferase [Pararobbsia alpina]CAB3797908.1 Protein-L-isoaspartate O-methyltransferase [Pararobbsia alpina]